jgi:hypothetical protein
LIEEQVKELAFLVDLEYNKKCFKSLKINKALEKMLETIKKPVENTTFTFSFHCFDKKTYAKINVYFEITQNFKGEKEYILRTKHFSIVLSEKGYPEFLKLGTKELSKLITKFKMLYYTKPEEYDSDQEGYDESLDSDYKFYLHKKGDKREIKEPEWDED